MNFGAKGGRRSRVGWLAGLVAAVLQALPFLDPAAAEVIWIAWVPLLLWISTAPRWRHLLAILVVGGTLTWVIQLIWLRHVTLGGTIVLGIVLGWIQMPFFLAARRFLPGLEQAPFGSRLFVLLGLTSVYVGIEWVRTWLLWGFPWNPLAASQWQRPVMLSILPWTGAWGLSGLIAFFNLAITLYVRRLVRPRKREPKLPGSSRGLNLFIRFNPELYLAVGAIFGCLFLYLSGRGSADDPDRAMEKLRVVVVQPDIPQELKWDADAAVENLRTLYRLTRTAAWMEPDLILWPESATPWPVVGEPSMRGDLEDFVFEIGIPILMGNMAFFEGGGWANIVVAVDPIAGLQEPWYAKRELVPFGEYNPVRGLLPFLDPFVPFSNDAVPGREAGPLEVPMGGGRRGETLPVGVLICYEDVFPHLLRETLVEAGGPNRTELVFVATNNAWYGTEAAAPQHAAHSVLRAAETRIPVVRAANNGWSGWIDGRGHIRDTLRDPETGSIYIQQVAPLTLEWMPREAETFYVRHGNLVVWVALVWAAALCLRRRQFSHRSSVAAVIE